MAKKGGLKKGLGTLFDGGLETEGGSFEPAPELERDSGSVGQNVKKSAAAEKKPLESGGITYVKLSKIEPNRKQPRKTFDEDKLDILAGSIKENGLIQPVIITASGSGMYKIVAGERRWRAARKAGLKEIPALIRDYSDEQTAQVALVENLQREDLNPIEEALGYNLLMTEFSMTQETVSQKVGKSRSAIANSLRLLTLDDDIKNMLISGELSSGHARAILSAEGADLRRAMAKRIIEDSLNVRQAEALAKQLSKKAVRTAPPEKSQAQEAAYEDMENRLSAAFGTKVRIRRSGRASEKGKIEIDYFGSDDLERIINMFKI